MTLPHLLRNLTVDLSYVVVVKSTVEILPNFVAFSEYIEVIRSQHALDIP